MIAELLACFLIVLLCSLVIWIAAGFYVRLFQNLWAFAKWIGRRLRFYFEWFSFLHRRRKIERFQALADRLWRRNEARKLADRNILTRS